LSELREQVGKLLRHHREKAGLTQQQLADQVGRSVEFMGRVERGAVAPSFETLEAFSKALNVPVRDFFGVGEFAVSSGRDDPLIRIVSKACTLDVPDLEWLDRVIATVLGRKTPRTAG
jgi:transcriptional regulator with XRE-family HTH domain